MIYMHAVVAAFRIHAQRSENAMLKGEVGVHGITWLIMEIMEKSWNCVFEFLWEPWYNSE